jgi:hypothetical protein
MHWGPTTVCIVKMLESGVKQVYGILANNYPLFFLIFQDALKVTSDCKEALPTVDVWRSATTMSGAQCVMTSGVLLMLKWHADSWDFFLQV